MKKYFRSLLAWLIFALGIGAVLWLNYTRTSFFKAWNPITLPATQFLSGGVVSGNYTSGGTVLMKVGEKGAVYVGIPMQFFTGISAPTAVDGQLYWDNTEKTLALNVSTWVTQSIGTEIYVRWVNKTGTGIVDWSAVVISGAQGNRPQIILAQANNIPNSMVIGIATETIADNAEGFVTIIGDVHWYDTSSFTAGDELYLSPTTGWALTNVVPSSPNAVVRIATALNSTNNGTISVNVHSPISNDSNLLGNSSIVAPTQSAVKSYLSGLWIKWLSWNIYNGNTGYVGIATTTPSAPLDVVWNATQVMKLQSANAGENVMQLWYLNRANTTSDSAFWKFYTASWTDFFGKMWFIFNGGTASTNKQFQVYVDNASTPKVSIDWLGNVWIGSSAPVSKLQIDGIGVPNSNLISSTSSINATNTWANIRLMSVENSTAFGWYSSIIAGRARWTITSPTTPLKDDAIFAFLSNAFDWTAWGGASAWVFFLADQNISFWVAPQRISFQTSLTNNLNRVERMVITSNGNVGIWTTTPLYRLQVGNINTWYMAIDNSWFMYFGWSGLAWNDIQNLSLWDTDTTIQKPALTAISGSAVKTRCFDGGTQMNEMFGTVEIPHNMYNGTGAVLSPHVHREGTTTSANTGVWYMDYTILKRNSEYTSTQTISWTFANITWRQARIDELGSDFSATWLTLWDVISFRIYRDPTGVDTYAGLMCLNQVWFHAQFDTMGSRQEYVK